MVFLGSLPPPTLFASGCNLWCENRNLFIYFLYHSAFPARHWMNIMQGPKYASLPRVLKRLAELLRLLMEFILKEGQLFLPENKTKNKTIGLFFAMLRKTCLSISYVLKHGKSRLFSSYFQTLRRPWK